MNFNKFKIPINIFGGIFLFLILNFALWTFNFTPALAQDAIQCKPPTDPSSGVNLNNNLRLVNTTENLNDIYLGTGEIYLGSDFTNTPYITKSGSSLSLQGISADLFLRTNKNVLFQTDDGTQTLAGIYAGGAPPAVDDSRFLIVNGKIEGWEVKGLDKLCVGAPCISSWSQICDPGSPAGKCNAVETSNNIKSGADLSANGNIYTGNGNIYTNAGNIYTTNGKINADNNDIDGKRLCIGGVCYDSWATAVHGGLNTTYTGTGTGVFKIIPGSGISISPASGEGDVIISAVGSGVSKIIQGAGITVSPASGDGNVTISATAPTCLGFLCVTNIVQTVHCNSDSDCNITTDLPGCHSPINPMPSPVKIITRDSIYFCKWLGGAVTALDTCDGGGADESYSDYNCEILRAE